MARLAFVRLVLAAAFVAACSGAGGGEEPLRVMVYNIHAGRDAAGEANLERVAALVESAEADLVLLQEVDRGTARSGGVDQLAELMRLTGRHGAFGKSLDYQGGEYGIAVLSRWPIVATEVVPLRVDPPQERAGGSVEPRIALIVETRTPRGKSLRVVNTHLDASRRDLYRIQEVETLLGALRTAPVSAHLIGGDFNAEPRSAVHDRALGAGLRDAWLECGRGGGATFPAMEPVKRIDYLFLRSPFLCRSALVLDSSASDHRPLLVQIAPE